MQLSEPLTVAAFDFDGTVTKGDSLLPYLASGLGWPKFCWVLLECSPWLAGYALRLLGNDVAKAALLRLCFAGRGVAEVEAWTSHWLAQDFEARLQDWTMEQLAWHKAQGHACVLVSASLDVYLTQVAARLGFDGLICTQMAVENGHLTGEMKTPNCHGEQKVLRLNKWLAERYAAATASSVTLYAYGDSSGDKPMLKMAGHAWYSGKPWPAA